MHSEPVSTGDKSSGDSFLNSAISLSVALAGTFLALCNVKGGNIGQAMQDAQSRRVNQWSYYQAKSTKQNLAEGSLEQLKAIRSLGGAASPEVMAELDKKITGYEGKIARYESEKADIKADAERWEAKYEELNEVDDQFDLAEAAMSVGIAFAGVAALVERRWLFGAAVVFMGVGTVMGLAGFLGWAVHIPFLSRLLS